MPGASRRGDRAGAVARRAVPHRPGVRSGAHRARRPPARLHRRLRPGALDRQHTARRCTPADADFAVWCSYKYLNGGPGAIGGCFVHQRHSEAQPRLRHGGALPGARLAGWWGHEEPTRFLMEPQFRAAAGAAAWQISNPPILAAAPLLASLALFREAGFAALRAKSVALTDFSRRPAATARAGGARSSRPPTSAQRGCQLSLRMAAGADARPARVRGAQRARHRLRLARAGHHPRSAGAALQRLRGRAGASPRRYGSAAADPMSALRARAVNIVGAGLAGALLALLLARRGLRVKPLRAAPRSAAGAARARPLHQPGAGRARPARARAGRRHAARAAAADRDARAHGA